MIKDNNGEIFGPYTMTEEPFKNYYSDQYYSDQWESNTHKSKSSKYCQEGYEWIDRFVRRDGVVVKGHCRKVRERMGELKFHNENDYKFPVYRNEEELALPDGDVILKDNDGYLLMRSDPSVNSYYDVKDFSNINEVNEYIKEAQENYKHLLEEENSMFNDWVKEKKSNAKNYRRR